MRPLCKCGLRPRAVNYKKNNRPERNDKKIIFQRHTALISNKWKEIKKDQTIGNEDVLWVRFSDISWFNITVSNALLMQILYRK
jgi:hypothetical protein